MKDLKPGDRITQKELRTSMSNLSEADTIGKLSLKDKLTEAIALLDSIMEEKPSRELATIINKLEEMKEEL